MALLSSTICARYVGMCLCVWESEFLRVCTVFRCNVYLDQYLFLIFANGPHTAQFLFTSFYFRFIVRIPFNITLLTSLDDDDDHVARRTAGVSLDLIIFVLIFFCVLLSFFFSLSFRTIFFPSFYCFKCIVAREIELNYCFDTSSIQFMDRFLVFNRLYYALFLPMFVVLFFSLILQMKLKSWW